MSKSGFMEVNLAKPLEYEFRMKINDLVGVLKQKNYIKSDWIEIFPNIKVMFVLLPAIPGSFHLNLFGPREGANLDAKLAGKVDVDIDGVSKTETFGNVEKNEFIGFLRDLEMPHLLPPLGPFAYTYIPNGDQKITVEVKWTIYLQKPVSVFQQEAEIPKSLLSQETLRVVGAAMMEDAATADLTIKCGDEIFRVHKVVLCSG